MKTIVKTLLLFLSLPGSTTANDTPVPTSVQGAIIGKVLPYVRGFQGTEVQLLVVYTVEGQGLVDEAIRSLDGPGISPRAVELGELKGAIATANAVYFLPGAASASVKELCQQSRVLSISAVPSLVESGDISIGIGAKNGRPQILVNLRQLEAEGHQVSSELLKLAKVIQ